MSAWTEQFNRQGTTEEQKIYNHLLYYSQVESPEEVIERFRALFISSISYREPEIQAALEQIIYSVTAEQEFKLFFNRCCYILLNRWLVRPQTQSAIPYLVALIEQPGGYSSAAGIVRSRPAQRLRQLMQLFAQSEQYQKLRRIAQFIGGTDASNEASKPLVTLIRRYPFLYQHCLISEDSNQDHLLSVRQIQDRAQKQFEIDLSRYLTYNLRRSHAPDKVIQPVRNPTLLSEQEVRGALKQFVGRVDQQGSYRDMAQRFLAHTNATQSYKVFKDNFYEYIVTSVDPKFGRCHFNNQLRHHLASISEQSHPQRYSEFLLARTCSQILNFLVVESTQRPNHYIFMDLLTNIGTTATIGLLLKIILLCKKVKPYLEKRFAILFNHYESYSRSGVQWLVGCLENLNIAWGTHFGTIDFSYANHLI